MEEILTPDEAYHWMRNVMPNQRSIAMEKVIATSPVWSYRYARHVLNGRFELGEPALLSSDLTACLYARKVLKTRWPEAEPIIAKDPYQSYKYATKVLKGRFELAEAMLRNTPYWGTYCKEVGLLLLEQNDG